MLPDPESVGLPQFDIYRVLVDEVRDHAIFMLNPNGNILTWNAGARRLKGYTAEEVIGAHFSRFYSDEDNAARRPERELEKAIAEGRTEDQGWRIRKDGSRFWANAVITALRDEKRELRGFAIVTTDLTERRAAEDTRRLQTADLERSIRERTDELREAVLALEEANRLKDEFLATLSHELRTPLTAIMGWVQLLRGKRLDEASVQRALEVVDRNIGVQTRLIEDLLNVSRIVSGKLKIEPRALFPLPVLLEAVESVRPSIAAKSIDLHLKLDPGVGPLQLDPARFQQIVWNLLTNAVKFTPRGGTVLVTLGHEGGEAVVRVTDTGEGIPPDFLPFVFDRFRQADASLSRRHGGLGIGLTVVRQLVELHGGTVSAESHGLKQGSTFIVRFPIPGVVYPSATVVGGNQTAAGAALQDVRVLVVEDEKDMREMVVEALDEFGASVHSAATAEDAMELLKDKVFDVIVSDIGMPGMDGYSLMDHIRSLSSEANSTPAIALTAYTSEEDRARSLRSGFDADVAKPVALTHLVRTITEVLRKRIA